MSRSISGARIEALTLPLHRYQGIDKTLREHCNIPVTHYFLAVILDDGSPAMFAGPGRCVPDSSKFFDQEKFVKSVQRGEWGEERQHKLFNWTC